MRQAPPHTSRPHIPWRDAARIIIPAVLAGPAIGGFFLGVGFTLINVSMIIKVLLLGGDDLSVRPGFLEVVTAPVWFAFGSYVFGALPALVGGISIFLHAWWARKLNYKIIAGWIAIVTSVYVMVRLTDDKWEIGWGVLAADLLFTACALVSGWVLYRLFGKEVSVWQG